MKQCQAQFHQGRLVELVNSSTVQFQTALKQVTDYFAAQGGSLAYAQQQAFAWISQQVQTQATLLAYRRVLGSDADLRRCGAARTLLAQCKARRAGAGRALMPDTNDSERGAIATTPQKELTSQGPLSKRWTMPEHSALLTRI